MLGADAVVGVSFGCVEEPGGGAASVPNAKALQAYADALAVFGKSNTPGSVIFPAALLITLRSGAVSIRKRCYYLIAAV